jgi:hypothetical protein
MENLNMRLLLLTFSGYIYKNCAYSDIFRAANKKFSYDVKAKQLFEI